MGRASRRKRRAPERRPTLCLGCATDARLTREHIVAKWLRREFERDTDEGRSRWLRVKGDGSGSETDDYARFDIAGDLLCQLCNNGWSAGLERRVQGAALQMIRPGADLVQLTAADLQSLAAWLAKMATFDEFVGGRISEGFARALIEPIATEGKAPEHVRVWLGTVIRHPYFRQGSWRMAIKGAVVHAISAGDLLGLVVLPPEVSDAPATFAADAQAFVRAWPSPISTRWPPARKVSIEQLNRAFGVSPRID